MCRRFLKTSARRSSLSSVGIHGRSDQAQLSRKSFSLKKTKKAATKSTKSKIKYHTPPPLCFSSQLSFALLSFLNYEQPQVNPMLEFLARYPRFNGFLLGMLQGVPQGIFVLDQEPWILSALSILDQHLVFIISFGFLSPPVFYFLGRAIRGDKRSKWWRGLSRYMNIYDMMFWGCMSVCGRRFLCAQQSRRKRRFWHVHTVCRFRWRIFCRGVLGDASSE